MQNPMMKLLGYVQITTGQLIIVDPDHLHRWRRDPYYYDISRKSNDGGGECFNVGEGMTNIAVCSDTYTSANSKDIPVYAHYDPKGKIYKLEIRIGSMTGEKED